MKTSICCLALALFLVAPSAHLLAAGADANAAPAGFPLIYGPVNEDHPQVVKLLLEAGARLGEHKPTLLEAAKTPEMRELLENAE